MNKETEENYDKGAKFERKELPTFVKSFDEAQGIVEHFVAIMGNVDEGHDRIMPGSFIKSIAERGKRVKVLDQHSTDSVTRIVGRPLELREVDRSELTPEVLTYAPDATGGLLARTQYAIDTTRGRDIFNLVKGGYAPESSIGYDALQTEETKERGPDGKTRTIRNLKQIRLWEYSNVIWGMNPATSVVSAKSADQPQEEEEAPAEEKAGRVLSARNAQRIMAAVDELRACMMEAGLMDEPMEEMSNDGWLCDECYKALGKEHECFTDPILPGKCAYCGSKEIKHHLVRLPKHGATGPQKSEEPPTSSEAGPAEDDSTRIKTLIQIEQEALKMLEVNNWRPQSKTPA